MTHMTPISPDEVLHLGSALWGSQRFLRAIELGVFTQLVESGPLELAQLRNILQLSGRSTRDLVDMLVTFGVLQRLADGRYANTAATELYLDRNKPSYIGNLLEIMNAAMGHSGVSLVEPHAAAPPHAEGTRRRRKRRPPAEAL
jgi:hypothetical protein